MKIRIFAAAALMACTVLGGGQVLAQTAPDPMTPQMQFVFEEIVTLGEFISPGKTPIGNRNIIYITGGTIDGPGDGHGIKGVVLPGGWDWQLGRADGCTEVLADYMLRTDDGVIINIRNEGALCPPAEGAAPRPAMTSPSFEAPLGKYEWLNKSAFVGTLEVTQHEGKPAVKIRIYRAT